MNFRAISRFLFWAATLLIVGCERRTQESSRLDVRDQHPSASHSDPESETSDRIPKTLDEALNVMMAGLTDDDRKFIEEAGEDYAGVAHFGCGMAMRNSWGLWGNSPLSRYFARLGIYHAEDMSGIINLAFSRRVRGKEIELDKLVQGYRDYWEKEDIVAPLALNCPHCGEEMRIGYLGSGQSKEHPDRVYFLGTCPDGFNFNFYHQDGWQEGLPDYSENDRAEYLLELATSHEKIGNYASAIVDCEKALRLAPNSEMALNHLAWILATTSVPTLRDGKRSISLALDAVKIADLPDPYILDTLAASYAATGDFKSAVATAEKAINLTHDDSLRSEISARLGLYKSSKPFISPATSIHKGGQDGGDNTFEPPSPSSTEPSRTRAKP
jgi:hypothetical protein